MKRVLRLFLAIVLAAIIVEFISYLSNQSSFEGNYNIFNFNSSGKIEASYGGLNYLKNIENSTDGPFEDGYYIYVLIENNSEKNINYDFEIEIDFKYKDDYLLKNAKYVYSISRESSIKTGERSVILFKTTKNIYDKYKDINPFSKDFLIRINDVKYKEDIKWNSSWKRGDE